MTEDIDAFVDALRARVLINAQGLTGEEVVQTLFEITDEMWNANVDIAWEKAAFSSRENAGRLFDITWLTMLIVAFAKMQNRNIDGSGSPG